MGRTMLAMAIAAAAGLTTPAVCAPHQPVQTERLLDSIGVNTSLANRGQPDDRTVEMLRYAGIRWVRAGIEGLGDSGPVTVATLLDIHRRAGVRYSWGLLSGGTDVARLVTTGRLLARADALVAFEGANEPNNWPVVVKGARGGGKDGSWWTVADLQRSLYATVKADPQLRRYPVWNISEGGAETDDVGLQRLERGGVRHADAANLHNYPTGVNDRPLPDGIAWNASIATPDVKADGLFHEYGSTWSKHFTGYVQAELDTLPRVSTETGILVQGPVTEARQGALILDIYLSQFANGYSHTAMYLLRDRGDEAGNQAYGLFRPDFTPRPAATWLHNLTTILGGQAARRGPATLTYDIPGRPANVHDLLLRSRSGTTTLVLWDERVSGEDRATVTLGGRYDVTLRDPTRGVDPTATNGGVDHVDVTLTDHPVLLTIATAR